jgi:hypothetical protein
VNCLATSGPYLFSGGRDANIFQWNMDTAEIFHYFTGSFRFSLHK